MRTQQVHDPEFIEDRDDRTSAGVNHMYHRPVLGLLEGLRETGVVCTRRRGFLQRGGVSLHPGVPEVTDILSHSVASAARPMAILHSSGPVANMSGSLPYSVVLWSVCPTQLWPVLPVRPSSLISLSRL